MNVQRYDWEDALVDAQTTGLIPNGALLLCTKLAKAINWKPAGNKPAGLYWKNEDALKAVGASRATYFRYRESLCETGFLRQEGGNLIPCVPEKSLCETTESLCETEKSLCETEKSLGDNPFSVDILSEEEFSDDSLSVDEPVAADASPVSLNASSKVREEPVVLSTSLNADTSPNFLEVTASDSLTFEVEDDAQSHIETTAKPKRFLNTLERRHFNNTADAYRATTEQKEQALAIIQTGSASMDIYEAVTGALVAAGAISGEDDVWGD